MQTEWVVLGLITVVGVIIIISTGIKKVAEGEEGVYIILGTFIKILKPGTHFVAPVISTVIKMNMLEQTMDIPAEKIKTLDKKDIAIPMFMRLKIFDSEKAYFEIQDYKGAITLLLTETLKAWVMDMSHKEILQKKHFMESTFKSNLNKEIAIWGIKINEIIIGEIEEV
jgi:regulator of protease activity HflC (stomatin/prohibitin superfamily)